MHRVSAGIYPGVCGVKGFLRTLTWHEREKIPIGRNGVSGNEEKSKIADRGRQTLTGKVWKELMGW